MKNLDKFRDENGKISALAIDQRGALRRMMGEDTPSEALGEFKRLVSENLTEHASAILLDPEYGWDAADHRYSECGLLMAYEQTGYDKQTPGRLPDLIPDCSVHSLKARGADGIKLLVYIDVDESPDINRQKEAFIERVGSECLGEDIPFFLEILTYDANIEDVKSREFAEVKPRKVIGAMREYSKKKYNVDVLKVEVPVNMNYVEGFSDTSILTQEEAAKHFKEQSSVSDIPFIFLSAGVSPELFQNTLKFAKEAGSDFNGILCGRATWSGATKEYQMKGTAAAERWLKETGVSNINNINKNI
ncbi:tagatose 1,6-diphosphate aldolase [Salinicoccus hispanicus]|uniref:Tagatose 1,6-diphosphate aldolase n=1 Tax=Salinicoccus hispanicus TaxID=157225 RepID=A0A6N8U6N4_9STAP|nr:tagatose 1,6-diphosphate aldolase [Salinicoccus hispanicus]MXQ51289.1 tagatose 1,6-diphosphate aldolase [Salinicoccus hispanicus]